MLPLSLLCLTQSILVYAQQQLPLNTASSFTSSVVVSIPPSPGFLAISVALCSNPSTQPRFLFTNNTDLHALTEADLIRPDVFEIPVSEGLGNWSGLATTGGILASNITGHIPYEIGVSTNDPIHQYLGTQHSLFGDSTSNQALLFSPVFEPNATESQSFSYPNYSLPSAQSPFVSLQPPSPQPQFNLTLIQTSSGLGSLFRSGCALKNVTSTGTIANQSNWLKDDAGWRSKLFIQGLTPQTNYTAYFIQDGTKVSGPLYFVTKSASFACSLVNSLPYCPSVSWAVPLPPPQTGIYDTINLPDAIANPLQQYLTNFTTTLLTFACGRDVYSPLQSCADCQREYRKWLCAISFPRCGDPGSYSSSSPSSLNAALLPQPTPRNLNFPQNQSAYTELLPCLEVCNAVDRACPNFVGFRCPTKVFNASASYGVGYIDAGDGGEQGGGIPGMAQDIYGNIWCNAG